jgi:hypothetical protein
MTIATNLKASVKAHTPHKLWQFLYFLRHRPKKRTGESTLPWHLVLP